MSQIRLLLVDDEEDYVRAMAARLEMRDVASRIATSGEEALQLVEDEPPDVMVLDLRMPGVDGMKVLERVKAEHPHVQVVILTGHGSGEQEREARRLGAFDYLEKPADTGQLVKTIRSAWKKGLTLLKDSADGFSRTMTAAALAEAGLPDEALVESQKPEPPGLEVAERGSAQGAEAGLKVLFVDDEEDFVRAMAERMSLRDLGGEIALSGDEALEMLKHDVPDVMVLDLRMPGLDGLEVLRRVKEAYPRVEVIIMTGHGSDRDEDAARRLGAFEYLCKPVEFQRLLDTIRRAGEASRGND